MRKRIYNRIFIWGSIEGYNYDKFNVSVNGIHLFNSEGFKYVKLDGLIDNISMLQEDGI